MKTTSNNKTALREILISFFDKKLSENTLTELKTEIKKLFYDLFSKELSSNELEELCNSVRYFYNIDSNKIHITNNPIEIETFINASNHDVHWVFYDRNLNTPTETPKMITLSIKRGENNIYLILLTDYNSGITKVVECF